MKKVLLLIGSPRRKGNSVAMANLLIEKLSVEKFKTETLYLYDYQIDACIDCRVCKKNEMICKIPDGMQDIYHKVEESDVLIISTPIYFHGPTAKTKLMIDRFRPYFGNGKLSGKIAGLLLPAGAGPGDCDLTIEQFRKTFSALEIGFIGAVTATAYDEGDVENDLNVIDTIKQLAEKIAEI